VVIIEGLERWWAYKGGIGLECHVVRQHVEVQKWWLQCWYLRFNIFSWQL